MTDDAPDQAVTKRIDLTRPMQTHILATVLRSPGMMARLRPVLDPDHFDDDKVADVIAWTRSFWDKHKQVPSRQSLEDAFREDGDAAFIKALWKQDVDADTEHTAERIRDFAHLRAWRNAVMKAAEIIGQTADGQELRDEKGRKVEGEPLRVAKALVDKADLVGRESADLGDRWGAVLEPNIAEILNPAPADVLGTGLGHLDACGVVLERGELGCVLGVSKRGKSHVLVNVAYHAIRSGQRVVYYSLEMKNFRVFKRLYARVAGTTVDMKQDPVAFAAKLREKAVRHVTGDLHMKQWPAGFASVDEIRAHLTQLIAGGYKPDVVVVDYAGLMRPRLAHKETRHNLESVFLDLRTLAAEFNVRLWTAAQANRGAVNKPVVTLMADFSECFAIVSHLDVGFSICMTDEEKTQHKGRFFVLASRNEQDSQVIEFEFDFSRSKITTKCFVHTDEAKKPKASGHEQRAEAAYQDAGARRRKKEAGDHLGEKP